MEVSPESRESLMSVSHGLLQESKEKGDSHETLTQQKCQETSSSDFHREFQEGKSLVRVLRELSRHSHSVMKLSRESHESFREGREAFILSQDSLMRVL